MESFFIAFVTSIQHEARGKQQSLLVQSLILPATIEATGSITQRHSAARQRHQRLTNYYSSLFAREQSGRQQLDFHFQLAANTCYCIAPITWLTHQRPRNRQSLNRGRHEYWPLAVRAAVRHCLLHRSSMDLDRIFRRYVVQMFASVVISTVCKKKVP